MLELYWGCFAGGILFALVVVILGDLIGHIFSGLGNFMAHGVLDPVVIGGALTSFGGTGILLTEYSTVHPALIFILALMAAILLSLLIFLAYVKPLRNSENSTGFSIHDLSGKIGEVITPVPANGYGEVLVKIGAGNTNQIAASFDHEEIQSGTRVVVVEVKNDTLYVARFENK